MALIKRFEGFRAYPYRCPAGYWTIGYGHLIHESTPLFVDELRAEKLLRADLAISEDAVTRLITRPLAPHQFDALVSFTYNLGAGALQRSRLRRAINRGDHKNIPAEFARWVFVRGKKLEGLVLRRVAEARIYTNYQ